MVLATSLQFLALLLVAWSWHRLVIARPGTAYDCLAAGRHTAYLVLGKYAPGKIGGGVAKVVALRNLTGAREATKLLALEQGTTLAAGTALAALGAALAWQPQLAVATPLIFVLWMMVIRRLSPDWGRAAAVAYFLAHCLVWSCYSGALFLIVGEIGPWTVSQHQQLAWCIAVMPMGMMLGMVAVFVPAGAGVRESAIALLLTPHLGAELGLAAALGHRAANVLGDLGFAGLALSIGRR